MQFPEVGRRDFAKLLGVGGLAVAAPSLLTGCSEGAATAGRVAAARTWRVAGAAGTGLGGFDTAIKKLMQARNISCGSLAVMRKGRLIHARGYTWSDDAALSVQPTSLFRLGSLSKAVTATAVMRLVQDGRLSLSTPVTKLVDMTPPPGMTADPRLSSITVKRLLQHLGGWDRDITPDPTYQDRLTASALGVPLPVTKAHMVKYGAGLKLNHAPGSTYAYSNYGYLLLGQIIEKVSGMTYAAYVQQKVFAPLGITRTRPGRSLKSGRAPGEVPYFSQYTGKSVFDAAGTTVPAPYGSFNVENRTAMGGWLASAVDYVRFTKIFDLTGGVLTKGSVDQVFAKPETGLNSGGSYYGFGWSVRDVTGGKNTWHDGSLPGTSTIVTRRYDGVTWAVLFDQRDDPSGLAYGYNEISAPLHGVANAITAWPTTDLFGKYF
ncbi:MULTISPECIES: serine hydrolase domain-containing protein [Thermomonosporaceae]|uniref:serine hydrolase domain-containing protein n=1 Tax=Thermomonosporaceae TaxID=2012 RepID=UPI00255A92C9|nr:MULTISPECIES: serine hydrolase domain-containing protein [Thermomonosporaceae]MDL4771692.1 serine hydrolase domain-containing protein [Actinomadura xylanilytica]